MLACLRGNAGLRVQLNKGAVGGSWMEIFQYKFYIPFYSCEQHQGHRIQWKKDTLWLSALGQICMVLDIGCEYRLASLFRAYRAINSLLDSMVASDQVSRQLCNCMIGRFLEGEIRKACLISPSLNHSTLTYSEHLTDLLISLTE